MDHSSLLTRT